MAIYECIGDVEEGIGASFGGHEVEAIGNEERIDGEDGDIVG